MRKLLSSSANRQQRTLSTRQTHVVWQFGVLLAVLGLLGFLLSNLLHNLEARNIASGFGFLHREAGFAIGESVINYQPSDSYGRAIAAGLLNTIRVALIAIMGATVLGVLLGLSRLSQNGLLRLLSASYIELIRNTPLLLQLFFWYALITEAMPPARAALNPLPSVYISNRGLKLPGLQAESLGGLLMGLGLALLVWVVLWHLQRQRRTNVLHKKPLWLFLLVFPLAGAWLGGASFSLNLPQLKTFNFVGGVSISPEFTALLVGLVVYSAAFVAEVVRAGIESVPTGQWEAARALGLSNTTVLRKVVFPQAQRLVIPPITSQYLNITKNSSLAVAIGYPDIVSVANTTLNRTGQAVEGILIIMAAYLLLSLVISVLMNLYNRRLALPGYA